MTWLPSTPKGQSAILLKVHVQALLPAWHWAGLADLVMPATHEVAATPDYACGVLLTVGCTAGSTESRLAVRQSASCGTVHTPHCLAPTTSHRHSCVSLVWQGACRYSSMAGPTGATTPLRVHVPEHVNTKGHHISPSGCRAPSPLPPPTPIMPPARSICPESKPEKLARHNR